MGIQLLSIEGSQVKMEVTVELNRSMLTSEENIQQSLNEVGCITTIAALKYLDTDGSALKVAAEVIRTKGEQPKTYQIMIPPKSDVSINSVAIGLDGTCMLLCDTGWQEAMVGTVSL